MKDKELRKLIGSRVKQRRLELNLTQPYVAEKMGVTASTILRYENGSIDNTKKMVLEGLSEALHVSVEWLKGETDEYETDITDKRELQIRDAMGDILEQLPLALTKEEDAFSKDLLLLMLKQYGLFLDSFQFACKNFKGNAGHRSLGQRRAAQRRCGAWRPPVRRHTALQALFRAPAPAVILPLPCCRSPLLALRRENVSRRSFFIL